MNNDKYAELQAQILQLNINEKDKSNLLTTLGDLKYTKILRNPQYILEDSVVVKRPKDIRKYDVISTMVVGIPHPAIIYKIKDDLCYAISFTTNSTFNGNVFEIIKSRFFERNYVTCTLVVVTKSEALRHFKCCFDNKSEADRFFTAFIRFYNNLFKTK
jgi:hypothetical protein